MKLHEVLRGEHDLSPWSDFKGKPVKLLNIYDKANRDIGRRSKTIASTVVVQNTKTKQIVGKRSLYQKDQDSSKAPLPYDDAKYSSIIRRVILFTPKKLILGKRSPTSKNPNQWNFIGGGVDEGESFLEAAVRELKEEVNLTISSSNLKKIVEIGDAAYFSCKIQSDSETSSSNEISQIKSFKLTDLPNNLHSKTQNFFDQLEAILQ